MLDFIRGNDFRQEILSASYMKLRDRPLPFKETMSPAGVESEQSMCLYIRLKPSSRLPRH